jgi:hypothetical protein
MPFPPPTPYQAPVPIVFNFPPSFGATYGSNKISNEDVLRIAQTTAQLLFQMLQSGLVPQAESVVTEPNPAPDETPTPDADSDSDEESPPSPDSDDEEVGETASVS